MDVFQRARSAEQREARRTSILNAAVEMLGEVPVSQVTMNGLSQRVGLAKSNVMRYFESREAVLLDVLTRRAEEWLVRAAQRVSAYTAPGGDAALRARGVASAFAESFAQDEVLCDLLSAQAAVLEHNVSEDIARHYKRAIMKCLAGLAALIADALPELRGALAQDAALTTVILTGALWSHAHPSPAVAAVYASDPALAIAQDFAPTLSHTLTAYYAGLLASD
jgi:AcrR family transcriptional regulator